MNDIQHFAKLIKDIRFCMFTTRNNKDGIMQSRPMTLQETEFDGELWFFGSRTSDLVEQINSDPSVSLSFSNPKDSSYVSAYGTATVSFSREKAEELWNPLFKAWYPKGLDDPKLCLIKVKVQSAEYWESPSSTIVKLVGFARAIIQGKEADSIGKHGNLTIN